MIYPFYTTKTYYRSPYIVICAWVVLLGASSQVLHAGAPGDNPYIAFEREEVSLDTTLMHDRISSEEPVERIPFSYTNTDLTTIIHDIARAKQVNVILPQEADALQQKVSLSFKQPLTLQHAEDIVLMLLAMAGYTMSYGKNMALVIKKSPNTSGRVPIPTYINTPPEELPNNDGPIRVVMFLTTMKVPAPGQESGSTLGRILQDLLGDKNALLYDQRSNAIIVNGPANTVASALTIIRELDSYGTRETVEVLPLRNRPAAEVAKLIAERIVPVSKEPALQATFGADAGFYFAPNTRVVPEPRSNSIILIGKAAEISKLSNFIQEHLDIPRDNVGAPVLRVYNLQYIDAQDAADTLKRIINREGMQTVKTKDGTHEQTLDGVVVVFERVKEVETQKGSDAKKTTAGKLRIGGNRLLITATSQQHEVIGRLIRDLDKIGRQVIIEVMFLDLVIDTNKILASQLRNPNAVPLSDNAAVQSSHFGQIVINPPPTGNPPTVATNATIAGDLLALLAPNTSLLNTLGAQDVGSTIVTFADRNTGGIWALLQILDDYSEKNIISNPYLVLRNNVQGRIKDTRIKRGTGNLVSAQSVNVTTALTDYYAPLEVNVTPRIASRDRLSLEIKIDIDEFVNPASNIDFTKNTRNISTNVNLRSGDVYVIGGLLRDEAGVSKSKFPLLGDIPIIGTLFRRNGERKVETNLVILISPTIVEPKLRLGLNRYTDQKIREKQCEADDSMFADVRDPVTRWFFDRPGEGAIESTEDFLKKAEYDKQREELMEIAYLKNYNPTQLEAVVSSFGTNPLSSGTSGD